jgi:hypothetical protein
MAGRFHFFLGGHDLEMLTIRDLVISVVGPDAVDDAALGWGAKASAYLEQIVKSLEAGQLPVLVELGDDLPAHFVRERLIFVDHHGALAGLDRPSSLRQVFDLLALPDGQWTRWFDLVVANDVGHIRQLRAIGASAREIRAIRDADRAAQGITAEDEDAAKKALAAAERRGALLIVRLDRARSSPVGDFLEPEYSGPGVDNLLVLTPASANFFGAGTIVKILQQEAGSWSGGALPERGFWGMPIGSAETGERIATRIAGLLND